MIEIPCNCCGSAHFKSIISGFDRLHKIDSTRFQVVQCQDCGMVFVNPQPEAEELSRYYPSDYSPFQDGGASSTFKPSRTFNLLRRIFDRSIKNIPLEDTSAEITGSVAGKNHLEFGCGGGYYLENLRKREPSWNYYGLDNSAFACEVTRKKGFQVFCDQQGDATLPGNFFDRIHMSNVIEHLGDPIYTLSRLHKSLKPGGLLVIKTPNFNSVARRITRSYWYALDLPRHLYFFTSQTLKTMLQKSGYEVLNIKYDQAPKVFIRSLYHVFNIRDFRISPWLWYLFSPFSYLLSKCGGTSMMTVYAKKKKEKDQ